MIVLKTLAIIKSANDPLVNIAGAYFPAWLACMIVGVIGTWLIAILFSRLKLSAILHPPALMISALFSAITLWSWLIFFSAK